jgi:hypothetical protein
MGLSGFANRETWGTCGGLLCPARRPGRGVRDYVGIARHGIRDFITDPF